MLERGVRPMGFWSTRTRRLIPASPPIICPPSVAGAGAASGSVSSASASMAWPRRSATSSTSTWLTRLDLPEPDTPVTVVNTPSGKATSSRSRLLRVMPASRSQPVGGRGGWVGRAGASKRNGRVCEASTAFRPSGGPLYRISPPCSPAAGPTSTSQSAWRITSKSCSTTKRELPASFRPASAVSRASVSAGCRPALGSSSTYTTPNRLE